MKHLWRSVSLWLPVLVLVLVLVAQLYGTGLFLVLRNFVFDGYQRWQPRPESKSAVLVVDIDEESLKRLGQWPWPRAKLASLIDRIREMGAAAIALDLLMAEPDRNNPRALLSPWIHEPGVRDVLEVLPDNDQLLAESISRATVSIGFFLSPDADGNRAPANKAGFAFAGPAPTARLPVFRGAISAIPELEEAAQGNGAFNFIPGIDGRVRRVPFLVRHRNTLYPSFAAEALRLASGRSSYAVKNLAGTDNLLMRIGEATIPLNRYGELWLHYSKPLESRYIPAWEILEGGRTLNRVKDAIVVIGTTATGLTDRHAGILKGTVTGAEIHAQVIEQVLDGSFLSRPEWAAGTEFAAQILSALALLALVAYGGAVWGAVLLGIIVSIAFFGSALSYVEKGWLLDPISGSITLLAVYLVSAVTRYVKSERDRRWIQRAFSSYVSPNLVSHLIRHPEQLELGGERRECSFVLTDLADFTPLIEGSDPADLTSLINEYLDRMTAIAFEHDGTLDRIVGDAVAVMFSAPVIQPDHARRAVDCALAMDAFAQEFKRRNREQGMPIGDTRIGVHSGNVIVGNFGGSSQLDYRALGDAINTASRLEGANKYLGTRICVSGATANQCPGFEGRPVGALQLKGKTQAIETFEPLTSAEAGSEATQRYLESYKLLESGNGNVKSSFALLAQEYPEDGLVDFHLRRLHQGERGSTIVLRTK
jgi:adenylate cyclase